MKILITLILICVTKFALAIDVGELAPDFSLQSLNWQDTEFKYSQEKEFILSEQIGKKPVYLVFWATWCVICKKEIPNIKKIQQQLGEQITILAINIGQDDTVQKMQTYQKTHQIPYPVAFDHGTEISSLYGVLGTPWQVIIDINGVVRYRSHRTPENLGKHINALSKRTKFSL